MSTYPSITFTQVPNVLLDEWMLTMSNSELRVMLFATRKIIGWHKIAPEPISISQFQAGTGLSRKAVQDGVQQAIERGVLSKAGTGKRGVILYEIVFDNDTPKEPPQKDDCATTLHSDKPRLCNVVATQKKEVLLKKKEATAKKEQPQKQPLRAVNESDKSDYFIDDIKGQIISALDNDWTSLTDLSEKMKVPTDSLTEIIAESPEQIALDKLISEYKVKRTLREDGDTYHYKLHDGTAPVVVAPITKEQKIKAIQDVTGIAPANGDKSLYLKVANQLLQDIKLDDFEDYYKFVKQEAKEIDFVITVPCLIGNGRLSRYLASKSKKATALRIDSENTGW